MRFSTNLASLTFLLGSSSAQMTQMTYKANGREVIVTVEPLDGTESQNSTRKCVEYIAGAGPDPDFEKACFDTKYNVNDNVIDCEVYFDDMRCNSCKICESTDDPPIQGYEVDCNNKIPAKTTKSTCIPLEDSNLQRLMLAREHFSDVEFDFSLPQEQEPAKDETSTDTDTSGAFKAIVAGAAILGALGLSVW